MAKARDVQQRLRQFALGLPGAWEDHPWDDVVVKVNKKIFVFLGADGPGQQGCGVKLVDSLEQALAAPGTDPMGYGLGRSGWVSVDLAKRHPPEGVLLDWIEESYRTIATKRLVAELDTGTEAR